MLENRRVLVVDDTPTIHEDFRKILQVDKPADTSLRDDEAFLFGAETQTPSPTAFELDSAFQGEEAIEKIRAARQAQQPYALAFVDMRMPRWWSVRRLSRNRFI